MKWPQISKSKEFGLSALVAWTINRWHLPVVDVQLGKVVYITELNLRAVPAILDARGSLEVTPALILVFKHVACEHLHYHWKYLLLQQFSGLLVGLGKADHLLEAVFVLFLEQAETDQPHEPSLQLFLQTGSTDINTGISFFLLMGSRKGQVDLFKTEFSCRLWRN